MMRRSFLLASLVVLAVCAAVAGCRQSGAEFKGGQSAAPAGPDGVSCPPVAALEDPAVWELAPHAKYRAQQVPGTVLVWAEGTKPRGGAVRLAKGRTEEFPPTLTLYRQSAGVPTPPVQDPFTFCVSFPAKERVERVTIKDRDHPDGEQVEVEAAFD